MTVYFDPTNEADLKLLPKGYRDHEDLPVVAPLCEADVIDFHTEVPSYWWLATSQLGFIQYPWGWGGLENPGTDVSAPPSNSTTNAKIRVYLKGYRADVNNTAGTGSTDPLVDPNLVLALKRTIAVVIPWRLNQWTLIQPGVKSATTDVGKGIVFKDNGEDAFPPDWDRRLIVFRAGRAPWGF